MLVFAIDPGTNSTGWAVFELSEAQNCYEPAELLATGVTLFGSSKRWRNNKGRPLTVRHRYRRRMRARRNQLVRLLIESGMLPANIDERQQIFKRDPYEIRARGLSALLTDHELGRAICHLAKRRGLGDDQAQESLPATAHGHPTWGAWLWSRRAGPSYKRMPVRNRLNQSAVIQVDLAPPRRALEHEFDALWDVQASLRENGLPASLSERIREIVFRGGPSGEARVSRQGSPGPHDPVVRIAVNQTCKLVGAMTETYGRPGLVVIEKFPSAGSFPARRERLPRNFNGDHLAPVGENIRKRLSLLQRQERAAGGRAFCPYTGTYLERTLALSSQVQIDHIIPASRFGGDGPDNLVLCMADANRAKAARTPREAFGSDHRWRQILKRAHLLPAGNRERLLSHRISSCPEPEFERHQPHSMRQIVNRILRRIRDYCPSAAIELVGPPSVAAARRRLGLMECIDPGNSGKAKNRLDHRHHAVDAIAAGMVAIVARYSESRGSLKRQNIIGKLKSVTVSARPQHGKSGQIHKQTVYGRTEDEDKAIYRKPLTQLTKSDFRYIRDPKLQATLQAVAEERDAAARRKALSAFSANTGIRRVRLVRNLASGISLPDKATGKLARLVQSLANHHLDIVCGRDGNWRSFGATMHAVRQPGWRPEWEKPGCGFKLVMRLHKGDTVEMDGVDGIPTIRRIVRLSLSGGRVYLADPNAAGNLAARHADPGDPFRWEILSARELCRRRARAVHVDRLGRRSYRKSNVDPPAPGIGP